MEAGGWSRLAHGARSAAAAARFFTHLPGADDGTQYGHSVRTEPHEIALRHSSVAAFAGGVF